MRVYLVWENDWFQGILFHGLFKTEKEAQAKVDSLVKEYPQDVAWEIFIETLFCPI